MYTNYNLQYNSVKVGVTIQNVLAGAIVKPKFHAYSHLSKRN